MSAAQYFDLYSEQPGQQALPAQAVTTGVPMINKDAPEHQIRILLDTVMFTGRVPLSTWTFTLAIADKLWVSDRTSLYFGKETPLRCLIYQDSRPLPGHRVNLEVAVAAYNNYGDVVKTVQPIRFYECGSKVTPSALLRVEHNWMQLMFKFRLMVQPAEQG